MRNVSAPPRYDVKPARFALNQGTRKLYSGGVTCPGLIRCPGLEHIHQFQARRSPGRPLGFILTGVLLRQAFQQKILSLYMATNSRKEVFSSCTPAQCPNLPFIISNMKGTVCFASDLTCNVYMQQ